MLPIGQEYQQGFNKKVAAVWPIVVIDATNVSPDEKFINLPWGATGTFTSGSKIVEAKIGKGGKVIILTKAARKQSTKSEKPAVDLSKVL